jgi:amino acid transporter
MSESLFRKKSIAQIQADVAQGMSDAEQSEVEGEGGGLRRTLKLRDLTLMGIAAIIGAGIFAMVGKASYNGGPAVIFLFIFTAVACAFSALCYAEFASRIPVAGSAYTYSYASLGELIAWIIGWDLIIEYAIGNIAIAISWSDYFTGLLKGYGINFPLHYSMDFLTAKRGFAAVNEAVSGGATLEALKAGCEKANAAINCAQIDGYTAWANAPKLGSLSVVLDLPALMITFAITALVYIGIRESKFAGNAMTILKIGVIVLVIVLGAFYVTPANWSPFAPNGIKGVLMGVSAVFFAYIGFDALSTTAEECKNPRRDLPKAMIYSLVICTVLYILLALVLTGMVSYTKLNVGDPLAFVFTQPNSNLPWVAGIIAISAVVALATVFLVFQIGQPRLWMAMSRDGLLPQIFSSIHAKFKTPWFATIITGLVVAIPALFMNLTEVTDLASIGTLFAFLIVCAGVLFKEKEFSQSGTRYVPYIDSQYIVPALVVLIMIGLFYFFGDGMVNLFTDFTPTAIGETKFDAFTYKLPYFVFIIFAFVMTYLSVARRLSLIPVLGVLSCAYLMSELHVSNWARFGTWLLFGLAIYFGYGYIHSHIGKQGDRSEVSTTSLKLASVGFLIAAIGLSVSAFSFINDLILYVLPNLNKTTLRFVEFGLLLVGLALGIYGALSEINRKKAAVK